MLQSMGSLSIRHDWATELNWTVIRWTCVLITLQFLYFMYITHSTDKFCLHASIPVSVQVHKEQGYCFILFVSQTQTWSLAKNSGSKWKQLCFYEPNHIQSCALYIIFLPSVFFYLVASFSTGLMAKSALIEVYCFDTPSNNSNTGIFHNH